MSLEKRRNDDVLSHLLLSRTQTPLSTSFNQHDVESNALIYPRFFVGGCSTHFRHLARMRTLTKMTLKMCLVSTSALAPYVLRSFDSNNIHVCIVFHQLSCYAVVCLYFFFLWLLVYIRFSTSDHVIVVVVVVVVVVEFVAFWLNVFFMFQSTRMP